MIADVNSQKLQRLNDVLHQKRPVLAEQKDVILLNDKSRSHVAKLTQQKTEQLEWEVLPHPPWSSDLSPTDYHLLPSLRNYLRNKHCEDFDELKLDLTAFFRLVYTDLELYCCQKDGRRLLKTMAIILLIDVCISLLKNKFIVESKHKNVQNLGAN